MTLSQRISLQRLARGLSGALHRYAVSGILLLALFLSGIVPQGMMRQAGADGMQLVLCTAEGPQEFLLLRDGTVAPAPSDPADNRDAGKCLAVNLAMSGVQDGAIALPYPVDFTIFPVAVTRDLRLAQVAFSLAQARAPPVLPTFL